MALLLRWLISALALMVVALLGVGVSVKGFGSALIAALVLGLANLVVRPLLLLFTLPINVLTLGLFTLVVNGFIFWLVSRFVPGFSVRGLGAGIAGALLLSVISWLGGLIVHV